MIFLLYFLFPILEIYLLIQAADEMGFIGVLGYVILTAWMGYRLIKVRGLLWLMRLQAMSQAGHNPEKEIGAGLALWVAGILLMLPGFISDGLALLCLLPPTRAWLAKTFMAHLKARMSRGQVHVFTSFGGTHSGPQDPFGSMKDVTPEKPKELE